MFGMIKTLFNKSVETVEFDDTPKHKGFRVNIKRTALGGLDTAETFDTLREAQVYVMRAKRIAAEFNHAHKYTIRDLETGRFARYMWQLTRADIA